jgi:hypothetical protein
MPRRTTAVFLSSDPATGSNTTDNGARMSVLLDPPIQLNAEKRLSCAFHSGTFWYTFPNVSTAFSNDHFRFTIGATPYDITFPKGLYSVNAIESRIDDFLIQNSLPTGIFKLDPDDATGFITFIVNHTVGPITVFWSDANSIGQLLGFTSDDVITVFPTAFEGDTQAQLNSLTELLVNFSAGGSYFNSKGGSNTIAAIGNFPQVGASFVYEPANLIETRLIGDHHESIQIWLTNASTGQTVDTNGEIFTVNLLIYEDDV